MSKSPSSKTKELKTSSTLQPRSRKANGRAKVDDSDDTVARVAQFVEQLHANVSSPHERKLLTARILGIVRARKEARMFIGSHAQAMPLFISILRTGTPEAKVNAALTLSVLSKDEDVQLKVLLGGCIPPLLSLLKSRSTEERKAAAEALYEVSSGCLSDDHVGTRIFVTEGVVPSLWAQLNPKNKQDKVVQGFATGALRNLCGGNDGYWRATLEAGGVDIIMNLLFSDNATAQFNAASLLARLILAFSDSIPKVINSGAIKALLHLVGTSNDLSVRASAADALKVLSSVSNKAKEDVVAADGVIVLIGAIVAPSKECMQGEHGHTLQKHATQALTNIYGGMSALLMHLGELSQSSRLAAPIADIIGALAYILMVFEEKPGVGDAKKIENVLVKLLKPRDNKLVQGRILEAMASLYGNTNLSQYLNHAEAKKILIGLITMAVNDVQENLIHCLTRLCRAEVNIWEAIGEREGIQMLISMLVLSSEQHQEYSVQLLAILTDQVDDSKWAITAAGGIPPLVQLLKMGSQKAREVAAHVLWNLCCHSEDIRACVESAGAVPSFLWLLKNGGPKGQEASAMALMKLLQTADSSTINQLLAMLLGDLPSLKAHVIKVLGHLLTLSPQKDLVQKGHAANKGLRSLVQVLNCSNEEIQESAASVLEDLFNTRQDICDNLATDEIVNPCMKLLTSKTQVVATQSARALGALCRPTKMKAANKRPHINEGEVQPLIKLAKTSSIDVAETAVATLTNLLSDPQIAAEALAEDVVSALTKVLGEGTPTGKNNAARALHQLLKHFPVGDVLKGNAQCRLAVLALTDSISAVETEGTNTVDALEVVAQLARTKQSLNFTYAPWATLSEVPSSLEPLVRCLAEGNPLVQDKAIEILSRLCGDQPALLGDLLATRLRTIGALADRIMNSSSVEVRVGGAALLTCVAREQKQQSMEALDRSGYLKPLIYTLVNMIKRNSSFSSLEIEVKLPRGFMGRSPFQEDGQFNISETAAVLGSTVALWLLSIISSFNGSNKAIVTEASGLETLCDKLADFEDKEGIWISVMLLALLFQDKNIVLSPVTLHILPTLTLLLKSDEVNNRYFAAQALASLVCHGNRGIKLAIANSGAVPALVSLIGYVESDMANLVALSEEFSLVKNPDQIVLQQLFEIDDIRVGSTARKSIPLLVDLLKPIPERSSAPPTAVHLLTCIADGSDANKLAIAEAGALDALTKYLSLSPQDLTEASISELLRILYTHPDLVRYEASLGSVKQLIAVLHLGSRSARFSAARALHQLFDAKYIRDSEIAWLGVQPLMDMLNASSEAELEIALFALIKLTSGNAMKVGVLIDLEGNPLKNLYKLLSSASSLELKRNVAELCFVIFGSPKIRANPIASNFIEPLISLIESNKITLVESGVCALERLLDDEKQVEFVVSYDVVKLLVHLVSGENYRLIEASICTLIKLGKDQTPRKLEMVEAGVIDNCLELLPLAPSSLCSSIAELFRILTNSNVIARSFDAAKIIEPLFMILLRPDFNLWGQHSTLQALVNVLEKPQSLTTLKLTPSQVVAPLISFLESPSQAIQQLGTELLTHLLAQEHFKQDITTRNAVVPLVRLSGIGILSLQQTAIKALEKISTNWPKAVADAGGVFELASLIIQVDPEPPLPLWESAAFVLCNILRSNADYYLRVPVLVLVKMLNSMEESTVIVALNALNVHRRTDATSSEQMAEAGAIDALLDLLRSHQCEEASGRLLEALFNNVRVRKMKITKSAIASLSQYLLDPQTRSEPCKILAALALGDLSQHEGLARVSTSVSACRALVSLLKDQPTDEMKIIVICALQNFVMHSRTNRRAVAEAGGIQVVQELLLSFNVEVAGQATLLIKQLFSNHTLQEYVSKELIRSMTVVLERELRSTATANEVLRTLNVIFMNFPKLHTSEAATLCIPHLVEVLKSGNEAAQESALDILCLLKLSWTTMPIDIAKSQAMVAAEAIPVLQMVMKTYPPSFHVKANCLLQCLPGCLTVTIKRGNNLKQTMRSTNAFCRLTIGNNQSRQTKVISHSTSPEWKESFTWALDAPPKGQKLHIVCKSKSTFTKTTLGRVTIQIDKVVTEGVCSGLFSLSHDRNKDGSKSLEIETTWFSNTPNDTV